MALQKQSRKSYLIVVVYLIIFFFEVLFDRREACGIEFSKYSKDGSESIFIEWPEIFEIKGFSFFEKLLDMSNNRRKLQIANIRDRLDIHSLFEKSIGLFMSGKLRRFLRFQ